MFFMLVEKSRSGAGPQFRFSIAGGDVRGLQLGDIEATEGGVLHQDHNVHYGWHRGATEDHHG